MTAPAPESHFEILHRVMLAAWASEPLPDIDSQQFAEFDAALRSVLDQSHPVDMHRLGCAAARALLEFWRSGLEAQRTANLAQLAAKGGLH